MSTYNNNYYYPLHLFKVQNNLDLLDEEEDCVAKSVALVHSTDAATMMKKSTTLRYRYLYDRERGREIGREALYCK